jgi:hypothetical protein
MTERGPSVTSAGPIPVLTDLDSRAAVKGSRDPLGLQSQSHAGVLHGSRSVAALLRRGVSSGDAIGSGCCGIGPGPSAPSATVIPIGAW